MPEPILRTLPVLLLAILILLCATVIAPRIVANTTIEGSNEIEHLQNIQRTERIWSGGFGFLFQWLRITDPRPFIPESTFPLILARLAYLLFGRTLVTVRMISLFAYLMTMVFLYLLGARLTDRWGGLAAAFFFACSPFAFNEAHFFSLYALGGCMVTLTLWLLIRTDHFQSIFWTVLFGIVLGWTLMTEQAAPILVLVGPVTVVAIEAILLGRNKSKPEMRRVLILLLVAAALSLLICGRYLVEYFHFFADWKYTAIFQPPHGYDEAPQMYRGGIPYSPFYLIEGPKKLFGYPIALFLLLLSASLVAINPKRLKILGILAVLAILAYRINLNGLVLFLGAAVVFSSLLILPIESKRLMTAWLFTPLILFSLMETKAPQYLYETIPAVALITVLLMKAFDGNRIVKWATRIAALLVIGVSLHQIALVSLMEFHPFRIDPSHSLLSRQLYNLNFIVRPKHAPFEAAVEKTVQWIPEGENGLIVYLPGIPQPAETIQGTSMTNPELWHEEFQIWLDYARPGLDHLLLSREHLEDLAWPRPDCDYLVWSPMDRFELARLWEALEMDKHTNVRSFFQKGITGMRFIDVAAGLPGTFVAQYEFAPGRKTVIGVMELTEDAEEGSL